MAQWDVHPNPVARARDEIPYLVVLQSGLLDALPTRWVAPLSRTTVAPGALPSRMTPAFQVQGERLLLKPHETGVVLALQLGKPVATLKSESHLIVNAIDAVFSGV